MTSDIDDDEDDFYATGNARDDRDYDDDIPSSGHNSGDDDLEDLEMHDLMQIGRKVLFQDLVRAVTQGHATPQEKNTLRQMLKDNGMIFGDPDEGNEEPQQRPKQPLPEFTKPEYL